LERISAVFVVSGERSVVEGSWGVGKVESSKSMSYKTVRFEDFRQKHIEG
jgi:hypothetical protein